jgi:uncharacterized protein
VALSWLYRGLNSGLFRGCIGATTSSCSANDGSTALLQTVTYGRLGAATLLLSRGANVDLPDASGNTPLMVAAEGNPFIKSTAELITLLLAHKAQLTVVDNRGRSALARATESKNTAAIEILSKK